MAFSYSCLRSKHAPRTGARPAASCWFSRLQPCRRVLCLPFSPACGSWPEPPGSPVGCVGSLEPGKLASCPGGCEGRGDRQIPTDSGQHALASAPRLTWTPTPFPGRTPRRRTIRHECSRGSLSCLNAAFRPAHGPRKLLTTDQPSHQGAREAFPTLLHLATLVSSKQQREGLSRSVHG